MADIADERASYTDEDWELIVAQMERESKREWEVTRKQYGADATMAQHSLRLAKKRDAEQAARWRRKQALAAALAALDPAAPGGP
jgi:hypothetical protein